jgi:hypothetical protein
MTLAALALEVLQELLGHHSLHQTLRYAQLYDTRWCPTSIAQRGTLATPLTLQRHFL